MAINFERDLNPAQLEAVHSIEGPVLVIAGAGSGKTRTIVYRLAYLAELGVPPESILLLTFTRKAAQEMLQRAARLHSLDSGGGFAAVQGGTFHSLAYSVLRRFPPQGYKSDFTIMDRPDAEAMIKDAKAQLGLGKGDRSYPRASTILESIGKARNKELELLSVLERDSFHLLPYADDFQSIADAYAQAKLDHGLMDYDDLLSRLETLLTSSPEVLEILRSRYQYLMVDEYQDTNMVQARLVRLLAGERGNVMAVGDDAQSIYGFRGADIRNILGFPETYPEAKVIKLERNYRSVQPILDLANRILAQSPAHFEKRLQAAREMEDALPAPRPELLRPASDLSQARMVVDKVLKLLQRYPAPEVAVLFRAGYQSYHVEVQLNKAGVRFRKYGGVKFSEAAHIKDVLAYLRLVRNPAEILAWQRAVSHIKGVGPKTGAKLLDALLSGDQKCIESWTAKRPELKAMLDALHSLRREELSPFVLLERIMDFYRPILEAEHPDDYPRRWNGLEELLQIAASYKEMDLFLADLSLENPESNARRDDDGEDAVILSTIHSAKGLEWAAVLIIDLVEERFPSRHALVKAEDFEEERRLMYVACTRAKDYLGLFVPASLYRSGMDITEPAIPSPFLNDIPADCYEEIRENHRPRSLVRLDPPPVFTSASNPADCGFCRHKIFGRGKIVAHLPPDKYRINFPGFGLKVILAQYLELE